MKSAAPSAAEEESKELKELKVWVRTTEKSAVELEGASAGAPGWSVEESGVIRLREQRPKSQNKIRGRLILPTLSECLPADVQLCRIMVKDCRVPCISVV